MKTKWLLLILILLAVAVYRSILFVDEAEHVIVTQFGRPVRPPLSEAGFYFKLPYQSAIRIDRRIQMYDPRSSEFLAREKKNLDLDVFVLWRVNEPLRFLERVNNFAGAEARLHDIVWSELAAEVGRSGLEEMVSTDPASHRLDQLMDSVAGRCARAAREELGIELVDVELKRISLPSQVRESVFQRMRAERKRIATQYRAEGEEEATKIRAAADKEYTITLARASAQAEKTRGEAEAEATRIYTEAHQRDPQFYELLRTLEAYQKFLGEKTTVLLSAESDLLKYLTRRPVPAEKKRNKKPESNN